MIYAPPCAKSVASPTASGRHWASSILCLIVKVFAAVFALLGYGQDRFAAPRAWLGLAVHRESVEVTTLTRFSPTCSLRFPGFPLLSIHPTG